jgi:hypothetical protein
MHPQRCVLTYRPRRIFAAAHEHRAVSPTPVVWPQADIGAQHRTGLAEEVFEVLPSDTVWQLVVSCILCLVAATHIADEQVHTPVCADCSR